MDPQVVLVTGASSGIGQATARLLAHKGLRVFGTSRHAETSQPLEGVHMLPLDVTDAASVEACVADVVRTAGRINVLVNNAGYALLGAAEETTLAEARAIMDTDFWGTVRMTQAVLPLMRRQSQGTIISMSVILGRIGQPFGAFLSAAKHALEGFCESLHYEVAPLGIHVALVEPQFVATNAGQALHLAQQMVPDYAAQRSAVVARFTHDIAHGLPPEAVARVVAQIALQRRWRLRYPVGSQAHTVPFIHALLPEPLFARVAAKAYGLRDAKSRK